MPVYREAGKALFQVTQGESLKKIVYQKLEDNQAKIMKVVSESNKLLPELRELLRKHEIISPKRTQKFSMVEGYAVVLLYELLYGRGPSVLKNAAKATAPWEVEIVRKMRTAKLELLQTPREKPLLTKKRQFVRVNVLKNPDISGVMETYFSGKYELVDENLFEIKKGQKDTWKLDIFKSLTIRIQEYASTLPVKALFQDIDLTQRQIDEVVDSCSAPGNKTLDICEKVFWQMSNVTGFQKKIRNTPKFPKISAFEIDPHRFDVLKQRVTTSVPAHYHRFIKLRHENFLSAEFPAKRRFILCDPSCSGERFESTVNPYSAEELQALADTQFSIVHHALTNAERVVYSTCTANPDENENLVARILASEVGQQFELVNCLGNLPGRGVGTQLLSDEEAKKCVRVSKHTGSIDFFVAIFEKKAEIDL